MSQRPPYAMAMTSVMRLLPAVSARCRIHALAQRGRQLLQVADETQANAVLVQVVDFVVERLRKRLISIETSSCGRFQFSLENANSVST